MQVQASIPPSGGHSQIAFSEEKMIIFQSIVRRQLEHKIEELEFMQQMLFYRDWSDVLLINADCNFLTSSS